jgi:hypothetical protein
MASTESVRFLESVYSRTDKQIRDLLAAYEPPSAAAVEIDTVNVIIGDGVNLITPGIAAAIRVDFACVITGIFFQEFDGTVGSIRIDVERSPGDPAPSWARISPATQPGFTSSRYSADTALVGWLPNITRGDYLRFVVASAALVMRVHVGLSIRRLE